MVSIELPLDGLTQDATNAGEAAPRVSTYLLLAAAFGVATVISFVSMAIILGNGNFSATFFVLPAVAAPCLFSLKKYDDQLSYVALQQGEDAPLARWPIVFALILWTVIAMLAYGVISAT